MSSAVRSVAVRLSADVAGYISDMRRAGAATDQIGTHAGRSGGRLKTMFATMTTGAAGLAIGKVVKDSIALEASYSKTMNVVRATTKSSAKEMADLDRLAMKMGADTSFSANDASRAILELARGGIRPAAIEAGALQGALTLAAAGELEMGDAANIMVKAMGQFNLNGKQAGQVAAALAGGANASSASVQDMAYALSQGGLAAKSVGFSLQETTGILAAFSNNGLEGSDAGTSLKTMLDRLQPTTTRAEAAMRGLGIITEQGRNQFIKANGEFASAAEIAELLKKGTEDLSDAEAKRLITQAFGSDAQRAATILAKEGADGIKKMTKATSDQAAADKMAKANMEGTAGALERMHGAIETTELALGKALAPTVADIADSISEDLLPPVTHFIDQMRSGKGAGGRFADSLGNVKDVVGDVAGVVGDAVDAFTKLPDWAQKAVLLGGVSAIAVKKLSGGSVGLGDVLGKALGKGLSRATPMPVFVVNEGFGLPGSGLPGSGLPAGSPTSKVGKVASVASKAVLPVAIVSASAIALKSFYDWNHKNDKSPVEHAISGGKMGDLSRDLFDPKPLQAGAGVGAMVNSVDDMLSAARAAALYGDELRHLPKNVRTQVLTPGLLKSVASVKVLRDQYKLTPQQVITALAASGVVKTIADVKEAQRTFDLTPKQLVTLIRTSGVDLTKEQVRDLQRQYDLTPAQVKTVLQAIDHASNVAANVRSIYGDLPRSITTSIITNHIDKFERQAGEPKATGGAISGPGTGTSDDVPILASNGEHMWTAAEVQAAGGHRRVERLRYLAKSGQLRGYAGGGAIGAGRTATVALSSRPYAAQSLAGLSVSGTLQTPWGPADIVGIVDERYEANRRHDRATGRRG